MITFERLPSLRATGSAPKINVAESKDAIEISVELPGVDEKDIQPNIEENQLVLSGEKKSADATGREGLACRGMRLRLVLSLDPPALPVRGEGYRRRAG